MNDKLTGVKARLEKLYNQYNRRAFVHPDPLEFLYDYKDPCEREIVALVASSLAYGRVAHILKSVACVLKHMTPTPSAFLSRGSPGTLDRTFSGFRHRFTDGQQVCALLVGIKRLLERHGSLQTCFSAGFHDDDDTVLPALSAFVSELTRCACESLSPLVPLPSKGSACKRLNLFLRWMVRCDEVDPGGWQSVSQSKLIVPLDTHMHRICQLLGMTRRKQAHMKTALEVTEGFRAVAPSDPVRYDFCLTRLGIRHDAGLNAFMGNVKTT